MQGILRLVRLVLLAIPPLLALRWPWPIAAATLRGEGVIDRTILAFLAPFALMLIGYPGYLVAAWRSGVLPSPARVWLRISIVLVLAASLLVLVWMIPSLLQIRSTLRHPVENLGWIAPPLISVICCIVLRRRIGVRSRKIS